MVYSKDNSFISMKKGGYGWVESKALQKNIHQGEGDIEIESSKSSFVKDFLALIKIGIINSNIITGITGMWLALFYNDLKFMVYLDKVIFGVLGIWFVIAGSCALNNYIDIDIDRKMKRTLTRPTVSGQFSPAFALELAFRSLSLVKYFVYG